MQISARVNQLQESSTLAVSAKARALKAQGVDVIGFGAGEPDFGTPVNIREAAKRALDAGMTHYMPIAGDMGARNAIAKKLREENHLTSMQGENVIISPGGKNSFYVLMHALFDPGDGHELILPTPAWVSYRPIATMAGATIVEVPTTVESDFKMSPDALHQALTPKSRVLLINSPSNPCGTMYTPGELEAIAGVVKEHNEKHGDNQLIVASDEIYEKLVYGSARFASIGQFLDPSAFVALNGLSKAYAMTGWRIGYTAGPVDLVKAMTKLQGQMTTCIAAFFYPAIVEAIENGDAEIEKMRQEYAHRAEVIFSLVQKWPKVKCPKPTGAFYIFPDVSAYFGGVSKGGKKMGNCMEFAAALLDEEHVAVVPGDDFGGCGGNHIRMSFCCSEDQIRKGMERIGRFLGGVMKE